MLGGGGSRIGRRSLARSQLFGLVAGALTPARAIVAGEGRSPLDRLLAWASESWPSWFAEPAPPLTPLAVAGGPAHARRALVMLFQDASPRVAVKVSLSEEEARFLRAEHDALSGLARQDLGDLGSTVPQALGVLEEEGILAVAMTVLPGERVLVPHFPGPESERSAALLSSFYDRTLPWSAALAERTAGDEVPFSGLLSLVDRFTDTFPLDQTVAQAVASFRAGLAAEPFAYRPGWQHADLTVGNVLLDGANLRVLDWEHAGPDHEPWFDAAYAPGAAILLARQQMGGNASIRDAALAALGPGRWPGRVLRGAVEARWTWPLPLGRAVTLAAMRAALRRERDGRTGWADWTEIVTMLVADTEARRALAWVAPSW